MTMIELFNSNISDAINKTDDLYKSWFGDSDFEPETTIVESEDFNCGAICNELEYAKLVVDSYTKSLDVNQASGDELSLLINTFINLPRRGQYESDLTFRKRFNFLVTDKTHPRRITKWSILKALSYFIDNYEETVQLIEPFDSNNLYFQIRIEAPVDTAETLTLNSTLSGFLNQFYLGGPTLGAVDTFLLDLLNRIKAQGVDFDVVFVDQYTIEKTSSAIIGTIQMYKIVNAVIKAAIFITKTSDAYITV